MDSTDTVAPPRNSAVLDVRVAARQSRNRQFDALFISKDMSSILTSLPFRSCDDTSSDAIHAGSYEGWNYEHECDNILPRPEYQCLSMDGMLAWSIFSKNY